MRPAPVEDRFELCGHASIELAGRRLEEGLSGARPWLCLAYLLLHRGRPVPRQELIAAVWPEAPPANPEAALATVLSRLRAALGADRIQGRSDVRLALPAGARVDVHDAAEAADRAESLLARGDAVGASREAARALEAAKSELLPGLQVEWLEDHRRALADVRARALACRAEAALRVGGPALGDAERAARELIRLSPYRETGHRLLMRALADGGDVAEALTVYEELRMRLREELGAAPSPATAELHRRLLGEEGERPDGSSGLSGTVTLLVAEPTGVDALAERVGEQPALAAQVTVMQLLRDGARTTQGRTLAGEDDRLVLGFDSSLRALTCATVMQQLVASHGATTPQRALGVRCGVAVGEVVSAGDALGGEALGSARRLCALADPSQVLVTDTVRVLAGSGEHQFAELRPGGPEEPGAAGVHELLWQPPAVDERAGPEPSGTDVTTLDEQAVAELEQVLRLSGVADARLGRRYSVVFAYPGQGVGDLHLELSGCTTQVCAIIEETATLERHGVHVVGLSTQPTVPPAGCAELGFPVGVVPPDCLGGVLPAVERGGRRYAARTSFVVFPDRTGVRITGVQDVISHVRRSLDVAMSRRLAAYRDVALEHVARRSPVRASAAVRDLLTPGADSVAIPRVEVKLDLVAKIAAPDVVEAEAGYVRRVNGVLAEAGAGPLFPQVLGICVDEDPAWYLMEAVEPVSLDQVLFADRERTALRDDQVGLLSEVLRRTARLYELTFRAEVPAVASYHYLGRFQAIPRRDDTRATYAALVGDGTLDDMLDRRLELDEGFSCRSYHEQLGFLEANLDRLLEPVGAYVHGDFHLPNMLLAEGGERVVLIDPRVVWDGHDVGDPGFCDPVYDAATLLQSLHLAAPALRAIADGESERLLDVHVDADRLRASAGLLRLHDNPVVAWCVDWIERAFPQHLLGDRWQARLHVGTANACLGWLKYRSYVQTRAAWLAVFSAVLYHLECARRLLDQREGEAPTS